MSKYKLVMLAGIGAAILLWAPKPSHAVASWARKYNASCSMCHRPAPPRLSFFGHQFRKRGYRLPDEVGQKPEWRTVGNYVSMRNRFSFDYSKVEGWETTDQFTFDDATLFFSGPITPNLSAFVELERGGEGDEGVEAQVSGRWTKGDVPKYYALRWGQMHTLPSVGWAGFDRPTAITGSWLLGRRMTTASPFVIGMDQRGLEFQHSVGPRGRIVGQVLNGMNPGSDEIEGSDDTQKDVLVAWEQAFDEQGSGLTLFGYRGSWDTTGYGPRDAFTRFALTGDLFRNLFNPKHLTEIQAGFGLGKDDGGPEGKIRGRAWYLDVEQYLAHDSAIFARYDVLDPDRSVSGNTEHRLTLGAVRSVNDHLRLAIELASEKTLVPVSLDGPIRWTARSAVIEAMINF